MSKTIRHQNTNYYKNGELVDSQYIPQNTASKDFYMRGIEVPNNGGRVWHGHKPTADTHRIYSGIRRAKIKEETNKIITEL